MQTKKYVACAYCDSLYEATAITKDQQLQCRQCGSIIDNGAADFQQAFIFALTAIILFFISHFMPFITLSLRGEERTITIFSSIQALFNNGLPLLAAVVFIFIIVIPLWYLFAILWVGISFHFNILTTITRSFLHWMNHLTPWNMIEVYWVGVLVTMVKILTLADIEFQLAFWTFSLLMLTSILAVSRFDVDDAIYYANRKQ